jgi:ubiquinone/menaquinone biosynthesis C-methylase UbiE
MTDLNGVRSQYAQIAFQYEQQVIPAFGPLAYDLAAWIVRCASARLRCELYDPFDLDEPEPGVPSGPTARDLRALSALDVGTGTGILARALAGSLRQVIGIDLSPQMLDVAARESPGNVRFAVADLHHLPLHRGAVQLVASSFGLNSSTPRKALRALARVLSPGEGLLAFQEWGVQDECSKLINDVLGEYAPDDVPGLDDALRHFHARPKPWYDQLQYEEDFYDLLKRAGFDLVWVREAPFVTVHLPSIDSFLASKLAWPLRRLTLEAMRPETRTAFYADVRDQTRRFANPDGSFDWRPSLFRVFATR